MWDWGEFSQNLVIAIIQGLILAGILKLMLDKITENKSYSNAKKELIKFYDSIKHQDSQKANEIYYFLDEQEKFYFQKFLRMTEISQGYRNIKAVPALINSKFTVYFIREESEILITHHKGLDFYFSPRGGKGGRLQVKKYFLKYLEDQFQKNKIKRNWKSIFKKNPLQDRFKKEE
jgi:hypothetical protein